MADAKPNAPISSSRRTLRLVARQLVIWIAIIAPGIVVAIYATQARKRDEGEKRAVEAFKCVMIGLYNFNDTHGCLPEPVLIDENDTPRASWRFLISNYVDSTNWYIPDERRPWIRTDNTEIDLPTFAEQSPGIFSVFDASAHGRSRIAAVVGPGSAFDDEHRCSFAGADDDTIVLVEIIPGEVRWTEPGDYTWDGDRPDEPRADSLKIGNRDGGPFHIAFKDGTIWRLSSETPPADVSRFFTVRGAREHDREAVLGKWRR